MKLSIFRVTLTLTIFVVSLTSISVSLSYFLVDSDDPFVWQAAASTIASLLVATLLLYFYSRRLLRPIRQIMSALKAFREGGEVRPLPTQRGDELGLMARGINEMMRDVLERNAQSELSRAKLEALFAVIKEGVVITDQYGIIESVNPSLCRMFGYGAGELLGQSNLKLMPDSYAKHHDRYMRDSIRTGTLGFMGMYRDLSALRKDGTIFPVVINVETLTVDDKPLFAAIIRDISKEKQREHELLTAKMRAEVANEAKSDFLSMMSHEIRTPLNGVLGVLQLLETEIADSWQQELLAVAGHSTANLLYIVNDILDLSTAESGEMRLKAETFNLRDLLEESVELFMGRLVGDDINLRFYMPMDMPSRLLGDGFRLQQMVNNLLGNAIKFTQQGEVALTVDWEWLKPDEIGLRIDIADTGIGIAEDKLKEIFEPFFQFDSSTTRSHGGTGLGLSIVKHITAMMGGKVWVNSSLGKGSTFHLHLHFPVAEVTPGSSPEAGTLQGSQVLYAGQRHEHSMLQNYLEYHQASVNYIDVAVLLENGLPGDRQYDVLIVECTDQLSTKALRPLAAQCAQQGQRIICLQGRILSTRPEPGMELLMLHEPVLCRRLDVVFRRPQQAEAPGRAEKRGTTGEDMAKILLVEDNPVNQMIAKAMLERMGYAVAVANNGAEAVASIETGNTDLVLMDCHMPVMDGFEATRRIRDGLAGKPLPIIAMTADAGVGDRERCLNAGMDDHIAKPIKFELLQDTVHAWLNGGAGRLEP